MPAAPAAAASRARAMASRSSTRVQPSTATRPSEASMPTMTCSPNRPHTSPRNAGSSAARVPTMPSARPPPAPPRRAAISRSPPPTCTGIRTAAIMARTSSVWDGRPAKAPSRSTTCRRRARESSQRRAIATGSSEKTVSASARPWRSRTHRPAFRSTAGTTRSLSYHRLAVQVSSARLRLHLGHLDPLSASRARWPRSSRACGCPSAGSSRGGTGVAWRAPRETAAGNVSP